MGKILKKFPRSICRQDTKSCRGLRQQLTSKAEKIAGSSQFFSRMLLSAAVLTLLGIFIAFILASRAADRVPLVLPPGHRLSRRPHHLTRRHGLVEN